ncbi:MAG: hypothetical protein GY895_04750 [Phycisphaera sp.]|nr:hypothetical protein [Phycisphaera sp.]
MNFRRTTLALIVALLVPLLGSTEARAQFGSAGFADAFRPEFLDRDMPLFVEQLQLEDWQRPIVEVLLQDYATSFEIGVEKVKEQMREYAVNIGANGRNEDAMKMILEPITKWDKERRELRSVFMQNVKAQLSSEQLNRWPRFERSLRREKELPKGELSGESVDLYTIFRSMRMPYEVEEGVDPLLVQYELELDSVLEARRRRIDSLQESMKEAMTAMDFDKGLDATEKIMKSRVAVRKVQDAWIDRIAAELPADSAESFRKNALERGYPKAFRPTAIPRLLESVRTLPDLSDQQMIALDQIEIRFDASLNEVEGLIIAKIRETQPGDARRRVERLIARRNGERIDREPSEVDKLVAKKSDLVDKTRREILAVLTPQQTNDLPGQSTPRLNNPQSRGGDGNANLVPGRGSNKFLKQPPKLSPVSAGESDGSEPRGKRLNRTGNRGDSSSKGAKRGGVSED